MSEGLNRVTLLGNLGADPELKVTQSGTSVLKLRLAVSESYKDRDGQRQERTEWASVVLFGRRAEGLAPHLNKGTRILVEGSLRTSNYEDRDGNKRYKTEIVANNIVFAGGGSSRNVNNAPSEQATAEPIDEPVDPDDIPF